MSFKHYDPKFEYEAIFQDTGWPWSGHKNFAYDFVRNFKPKTIVELGTHKGTSLWSFAQAAKDGELDIEISAVDTWQGEEHAGFYGEEIFDEVKKIKETFYPKIKINLLRKTFDEAVSEFKDKSIDLLHIDGLHTYEAVKHDFETWLPKVEEDGAIMFHDIFVSKGDFGVYKLWEELRKKYDGIEFHHSFGLGVLFLKRTKYIELFQNEKEKQRKYSFLSEDSKRMHIFIKKEALTEQTKNISRLEKIIESQKEKLILDKDIIAEKDEQIELLDSKTNRLSGEIELIKNSKFWRLRERYLKTKQLRPKNILNMQKEAFRVLREKGLRRFLWCIPKYITHGKEYFLQKSPSENVYEKLVLKKDLAIRHAKNKKIESFNFKPKFSIILDINFPSEIFLRKNIFSILNQSYPKWELFLVNRAKKKKIIQKIINQFAIKDKRIRIFDSEKAKNIFTCFDQIVKTSRGDYFALVGANDELDTDTLYEFAKKINEKNKPDVIYSDEDLIDENSKKFDPKFKPDWSPELIISNEYTGKIKFISRKIIEDVKGYKNKFKGAEEYDLMLRIAEKTDKISHIPRALYHKRFPVRSLENSITRKEISLINGRLALKRSIERRKINGRAGVPSFIQSKMIENYYRIKFDQDNFSEKVTIIIPTKDNVRLLSKCIKSIRQKTDYKNYELLIINNNSEKKETFDYLKRNRINYIDFPTKKFNFSKINNFAVSQTSNEFIVFMNNDVEVLNSHWLTEMVGTISLDKKIGAVGAKLIYDDRRVQHGGVILGMSYLTASHANKFIDVSDGGYQNYNLIMRNYSAVTAACMLTRKSLFEKVNGFDEKNLAVAFNDVDYCLKLGALGYRIVWNPEILLLHHESLSRGTDNDDPAEPNYFRKKWLRLIKNDPYYNPNLSLENEQFKIAKK